MKSSLTAMTLLSLLALMPSARAFEIVANPGLAENDASPLLASIQFIKFDLTSSMPVKIKTGDDLDPDSATTVTVPQVGSMAWCDPGANPLDTANTDITQCYGSATDTKFVVLDFNKAQKKGAKAAYLRLTLKAHTDADNQNDDDLVPALTVFRGRLDPSEISAWYPNKFQTDPAQWPWQFTAFTGKPTNNSPGWSTAFSAQGSSNKTVLVGKFPLKRGGQNYLTLAIGGDARHGNLADKHPVNFELSVEADSKRLLATDSGNVSGELDKCNCKIGVTQWHPSMSHCMAIALCLPIAGTPDECKTPAMCERDGGR